MAGDWIKIEENTPYKPEVCQIAASLGLDVDAVTGKLIRIWAWASRNCHGDGVTSVTVMSLLDRDTGVTGFCDAMISAGWLIVENEKLVFPNFHFHISQSAKDRASEAKRKQRSRNNRDKRHAETVTSVTKNCDKNVTIEKRREEEIQDTHNAGAGACMGAQTNANANANGNACTPPTVQEVTDWGALALIPAEFCQQWHEDMTNYGWKYKGQSYCTTPTSWRPKLRDWWKSAQSRKHEQEARAAGQAPKQFGRRDRDAGFIPSDGRVEKDYTKGLDH